jgi:acylglycerol lipase
MITKDLEDQRETEVSRNYDFDMVLIEFIGHVDSFHTYARDLQQFIQLKKKENSDRTSNIFCIGQSMGASILVEALRLDPSLCNSGVVLSSPAVHHSKTLENNHLLQLFEFTSKYLPKLPVLRSNQLSEISRDPKEMKKFETDPYPYPPFFRSRFSYTMWKAIEEQRSRASELKFPVLVVQGKKDEINPLEEVQKFFSLISSTDKKMKVYENASHYVLHDFGNEVVVQEVINWIKERTK